MAMLEFLDHFFSIVCGQNAAHTWAPGGVSLPFCERCAGLYVGAAIALLLHLCFRPKLTARFLQMHGAFLLLMVPLGFHWVPQGPVLRTLSGLVFGAGLVTFLLLRFVPEHPAESLKSIITAQVSYLAGLGLALAALPCTAVAGGYVGCILLALLGSVGALALAALVCGTLAGLVVDAFQLWQRRPGHSEGL